MRRRFLVVSLAAGLWPAISFLTASQSMVTYEKDVKPIVKKYCLPCHLADSENPSGLALDSYESLRLGGENGDPVVQGSPEESILYLKLQDPPPFGRQMPRNRKKVEDKDIETIKRWIEKGAREK